MKIHALTLHVEDDGSTRQCKTYTTWRENGVLRKAELIIEVQGDFVKAWFSHGLNETGVMGDIAI